MSLIRSHGNKVTELRLIEVFEAHGITGCDGSRSCK